MGCGQAVRRRNLSPLFKGSNPFIPAKTLYLIFLNGDDLFLLCSSDGGERNKGNTSVACVRAVTPFFFSTLFPIRLIFRIVFFIFIIQIIDR